MSITPSAAGISAREDSGDEPLTAEELEDVSGGVDDLEGCDVSCLPNIECSGIS